MTRRTTPRTRSTETPTGIVRAAFRPDELARICVLDDFTEFAPRHELPPGRYDRERFFHYKDNGSNILAVAHLDSVEMPTAPVMGETAGGWFIASPTLDDRLGAYVILDLLPRLGITCDWLLTTDEEIGASTASDFGWTEATRNVKPYNWIIEFDRGGTDVVMYQFEREEYVDMVEDTGARVGLGSFSDICYLDHLGCAAFNWGVGYEDYHGPRAHAWLEDTFRMVGRFMKFHAAHADTFLPHVERDEAYEDDDDWFLGDDDEDGPYRSMDDYWERRGMSLIDLADAEPF